MYRRHRRLSRRSRRQAEADRAGCSGSPFSASRMVSGSIAWMIGRSISKPLGQLGARMQELAEGKLDGEIPGRRPRRRGRRDGRDRPDLQGQCGAHPRARTGRGRDAGARRGRAARRDGEHRQRFRTQRDRHRPLGLDGGRGHADHRAVDDGDRQRRQRARGDGRRGVARARPTMSARSRRPPKSFPARSPRFPARWRAPARSPARRSATPSAPTPPSARSRPAPRRSAKWSS